jgi:hypothetical protein
MAQTQPQTRVVRIQRKDGQIVQDCDVYIGRRWTMGGWNLPESKWANPYPVKKYGRDEALRRYVDHLQTRPDLLAALPELRGKTLGCFCPINSMEASTPSNYVCHGQILIDLLNRLYPV